jgi:hypothetical protein
VPPSSTQSRRAAAAADPQRSPEDTPRPTPPDWALLRELLAEAVAAHDLRAVKATAAAAEALATLQMVRHTRALLDRADPDVAPAARPRHGVIYFDRARNRG